MELPGLWGVKCLTAADGGQGQRKRNDAVEVGELPQGTGATGIFLRDVTCSELSIRRLLKVCPSGACLPES